MSVATAKISLEEFLAMPGATFHDLHELHNGEIVDVAKPTAQHYRLQKRFVVLLDRLASGVGYEIYSEYLYTLEGEMRRADVAMLRTERLDKQPDKVFFGAPELVIEILSPSNEYMDVDHIRELCLVRGGTEFWVVNLEFKTVTVFGRDHAVHIYSTADELSLHGFGISAVVPVVEIFQSQL